MPVVQRSMMLLDTVTGPGTVPVLPSSTPRDAAASVPVTLKPEMVTFDASLTTKPPFTIASATRVPLPATLAFGPRTVRDDVIDTAPS